MANTTSPYMSALESRMKIQHQLNKEGINADKIEEWLKTNNLRILDDNKALAQYFSLATRGLQSLTLPQYDGWKSLSGQVPSLDYAYQSYFEEMQPPAEHQAMHRMLYNLDFDGLVKNNYMSPKQVEAFQKLMEHGFFPDGETPEGSGDQVPYQEIPQTEGGSSSGSTKALSSTGKPPSTKLFSEFPGAPPPPPGGFPPTGPGVMPGPMPGQPGSGYFTQRERDYLGSLNLGAAGGWLSMLLDRADMARGVSVSILGKLNAIRARTAELNQIMAGIDPNSPDGAHRIQVLTNELQGVRDDEKMLLNNLTQVEQSKNQFVTLVSEMINKIEGAENAIIRNMART